MWNNAVINEPINFYYRKWLIIIDMKRYKFKLLSYELRYIVSETF